MELELTSNELRLISVSHEFKSPINIILSSLSILKNNNYINKDGAYLLDYIQDSTYKLLKISQNIIEAIRLEDGNTELMLSFCDYINYIQNLINMSSVYFEIKNIKVNFKTKISEKYFNFDKGIVDTVIMNLLSNAIKFSKENSKITIDIIEQDDKLITTVSNKGEPISEENQKKLFDKFFTVGNTISKNEGGCGLGLYISKLSAKVHLGDLYFKIEPKNTTSFVFELPTNLQSDSSLCDKTEIDLGVNNIAAVYFSDI